MMFSFKRKSIVTVSSLQNNMIMTASDYRQSHRTTSDQIGNHTHGCGLGLDVSASRRTNVSSRQKWSISLVSGGWQGHAKLCGQVLRLWVHASRWGTNTGVWLITTLDPIRPHFISFYRCTSHLGRVGLYADGTAVDMHNIKLYFTYD